ncbi:hypothetical protein K488DRAFT_71914 [Vararia minispora EC-137]|uniref:Uncharacterized protein n=1 Tax=Vararia minispora EC-137 TaxID=1314806 RepID=A0ACB8QGT1_9AGAM|nr:hypothetical protein K488DRAFT_71914 [Vararia minispora EC-137]
MVGRAAITCLLNSTSGLSTYEMEEIWKILMCPAFCFLGDNERWIAEVNDGSQKGTIERREKLSHHAFRPFAHYLSFSLGPSRQHQSTGAWYSALREHTRSQRTPKDHPSSVARSCIWLTTPYGLKLNRSPEIAATRPCRTRPNSGSHGFDMESPSTASRQPVVFSTPVSGPSRLRPPPRASALKVNGRAAPARRKVRSSLAQDRSLFKSAPAPSKTRQRVRFSDVMTDKGRRAARSSPLAKPAGLVDVMDSFQAMAVESNEDQFESARDVFGHRYPSPSSSATSSRASYSPPRRFLSTSPSTSSISSFEGSGADMLGELPVLCTTWSEHEDSKEDVVDRPIAFHHTFRGTHRGSPPPF